MEGELGEPLQFQSTLGALRMEGAGKEEGGAQHLEKIREHVIALSKVWREWRGR